MICLEKWESLQFPNQCHHYLLKYGVMTVVICSRKHISRNLEVIDVLKIFTVICKKTNCSFFIISYSSKNASVFIGSMQIFCLSSVGLTFKTIFNVFIMKLYFIPCLIFLYNFVRGNNESRNF